MKSLSCNSDAVSNEDLWADSGPMNDVTELAATDNFSPSPLDIANTDFEDWQKFESGDTLKPRKEVSQFSTLAMRVMKSCFETGCEDYSTVVSTDSSKGLCNHRLYRKDASTVTCPEIQSTLQTLVTSHIEEMFPRLQLHLDLPAECNDFDWDLECCLKRDSISPMLFRPGQPESPVGVDFDHERASLGLSVLSESELNAMCQEMESKFSRLSESLVVDLQLRDKLVIELTVKNKFISAMLRVQSLKQSCNVVSSGSGGNGGRARSKSMRSKLSDERINGKYLSSIIPYCPPEDNNWSVATLLAIIEILNSIAEDSDNVSTLVAEYLQNEVLR